MSRGWESKNVESQQELQAAQTDDAKSTAPKVDRKGNQHLDADHKRKLQELHLQREFLLSQRTSSPHRRSALAVALTDIEEKLAELGWTVHL